MTDRKLRILDLFAGLGGASSAFEAHDVVTTDIDPRFNSTITGDLFDPAVVEKLLAAGPYDFVWASPPCEGFSVMTIGKNWTPEHEPKTEKARWSLDLVEQTLEVIRLTGVDYFIIENPRAKLRKLPVMAELDRRTVTYCQLGLEFMKPTDLWGEFPPSLVLPEPCKNGDPCHVRAPRGSSSGIQGKLSPAERAKVPYRLSELVRDALERDVLGKGAEMSSTNRGYNRHVSDYYRTPIEDITLFLERYHSLYGPLPGPILDPCAGGDDDHPMSYPEALKQQGYTQIATMDIREDSRAKAKGDYLTSRFPPVGTIITNPPFLLAQEVAEKALAGVRQDDGVVVMLQRLNWLGSAKRKSFWDKNMPTDVFVHHKRLSFIEGATDSVEYAHFVWRRDAKDATTSRLHLL